MIARRTCLNTLYIVLALAFVTFAQLSPQTYATTIGRPSWFLWVLFCWHWLIPRSGSIVFFAWLLGLWQDALLGSVLGTNALLNTVVMALVENLDGHQSGIIMDGRQLIVAVLLVILHTFLAYIVNAVAMNWWPLFLPFFGSGMLTAVLVLVTYLMIMILSPERWHAICGQPQ